MTQNQIAYQNLLETRRTNLAKEAETNRHNQADEYAKLIRATNNPFSLISHAAGGERNAGRGILNILKSAFGYDSNEGIQIGDGAINTEKGWLKETGQYNEYYNRGPGNVGVTEITSQPRNTLFY
jgi:hypothetical protein